MKTWTISGLTLALITSLALTPRPADADDRISAQQAIAKALAAQKGIATEVALEDDRWTVVILDESRHFVELVLDAKTGKALEPERDADDDDDERDDDDEGERDGDHDEDDDHHDRLDAEQYLAITRSKLTLAQVALKTESLVPGSAVLAVGLEADDEVAWASARIRKGAEVIELGFAPNEVLAPEGGGSREARFDVVAAVAKALEHHAGSHAIAASFEGGEDGEPAVIVVELVKEDRRLVELVLDATDGTVLGDVSRKALDALRAAKPLAELIGAAEKAVGEGARASFAGLEADDEGAIESEVGVRQEGKTWIVSLDPRTGDVREKEPDEEEDEEEEDED